MNTIHLRNHTHYSLLRALPKVDVLVKKAAEYGYTSLALTDTSNMYGIIEFQKECEKRDIKPIFGVELKIKVSGRNYDVVFLAKNEIGYKNLMLLTSIANTKNIKNDDPHITFEDFIFENENTNAKMALKLDPSSSSPSYGEGAEGGRGLHLGGEEGLNKTGLICLSGGPWGEVSTHLKIYDEDSKLIAKNILDKYANIFHSDYYLEVTNHIYMDYGKEMRENTINFAKENNIKLVATNNTHYISSNDKPAHKTLIQIDSEIDASEYYKVNFSKGDFHFLNKEEFIRSFSDVREAVENTSKIAEQINFKIKLGAWVFPAIEYKKSYDEDLRELAYAGLEDRNKEKSTEVLKRLDYELEVIKNKGYSPYFLVVYDLLRFSRENGILTNIRGSVAGSLVTYLLRITKCDPLTYKLPFERFLNPERPSAPDIDMDYADDRRDDVLNYARSKYGADHVAQIGTFGTMMARGAVRDVARAMSFPYLVGDKLSRLIPPPKQGFPVFIESAIKDVAELKELYETDRDAAIILDMAKQLEGNVRHVGVHAAGTVISPAALTEWTPIQYDPKGEGKLISQYDMYTIEDAGLLKFDFLGIRNLSILATAIKTVKELYNIDVDIEEISEDDKLTFEMLSRGETMGLFQLNGSGMTRFLKELKPSSVHDINAMVALYRPGPLEMIPEYIKRKHNPELITYLDERLRDILDMSYGVIVYQDDVMLTAIHLAGYSWLEADKLRKAMGKKIPAEMAEQKEKLMKGFLANGLSKSKGDMLWTQIEPFAAYGFNKAHAASYGRVAYQTAYMKAHYPQAYMTAIMTNESGDVDKISEIVSECKRMNISVLPPHINDSVGGFSISKNNNGEEEIRFGLYTIKNFGVDIADAVIKERNVGGKFKSLENFINRISHKNLNKKSIEALAMCGALDGLAERNAIIQNIESILEYHKSFVKDNKDQGSLFGDLEAPKFTLRKVKEATQIEKLKWEKELLGLYVSGFPLDPWKDKILERKINIDKIHHEYADEFECSVAALVEKVKVTKTKKGDFMALITVRDYSGVIEMAVFPKTFTKLKEAEKRNGKILMIPDSIVIIKGKVSSRNDEKTFVVDEIKELT